MVQSTITEESIAKTIEIETQLFVWLRRILTLSRIQQQNYYRTRLITKTIRIILTSINLIKDIIILTTIVTIIINIVDLINITIIDKNIGRIKQLE